MQSETLPAKQGHVLEASKCRKEGKNKANEGMPALATLRVVLTGVSSDSHTWNLVFMQLLLEHMGHKVHNLGACTPDEEITQVCLDTNPDLLVVSTVNGHGNIDGERMIRNLRRHPTLRDLPAVIGGKLGIRGLENADFIAGLHEAGFTAVFSADADIRSFEAFVGKLATVGRLDAPEEYLS